MSRIVHKTIEIDYDFLMEEITDEELLEELKFRGYNGAATDEEIREMWYHFTMGNQEKFTDMLREFFWKSIGKTI